MISQYTSYSTDRKNFFICYAALKGTWRRQCDKAPVNMEEESSTESISLFRNDFCEDQVNADNTCVAEKVIRHVNLGSSRWYFERRYAYTNTHYSILLPHPSTISSLSIAANLITKKAKEPSQNYVRSQDASLNHSYLLYYSVSIATSPKEILYLV